METTKFKTVKEYFAAQPAETKKILNNFRKIIKEAAPAAEEVISYNMPAFKLNGMLIWYAGYKKHIGLYPKSGPIIIFKDELKEYKTSKGAIQFPLDRTIPVALVKKIVKYRIKENMETVKLKKK